jgi:3-oxoacyl-[acyl-carrier protein] reductase
MHPTSIRALVTGGSSGIGRATAALLVQRGGRVVITARDDTALRAAASAIGAIPVRGDVSNEDDVRRIVAAAIAELGDYNVLINNAGFGLFAPLLETTADMMRRVWETNVLGALFVARESARHFVARGGGSIVNIASTSGSRGYAGGSAYCSSKFALSGLTECWRAELRTKNVRVMQVNPSEVLTSFFATAGRQGSRADNPTKLHAEDIAHAISGMLEMDDRGFITDATVWATNPRDDPR